MVKETVVQEARMIMNLFKPNKIAPNFQSIELQGKNVKTIGQGDFNIPLLETWIKYIQKTKNVYLTLDAWCNIYFYNPPQIKNRHFSSIFKHLKIFSYTKSHEMYQ